MILLKIVVGVLLVEFCIRLGIDYYGIVSGNYSAPFYLFVIERGIEFILPALVLILVERYLKKKDSSSKISDTTKEEKEK